MKVTAEKIEGSRVVLTIEAPASVVDEALDKAYRRVVKRVNVPGFRRGKAPRYILERHVGKDALYEEAMKEVLPEQYEKAVEEAKIEPVSEPEFDDVDFKQGEPLRLKAAVYVRPEVRLDDYDELSIPYEVQEVTDEDVDQQISFLRERMAQLTPLSEDLALEKGDYATCHIKGLEGGSFKPEIDQELSYVEVGSEYGIVPGLSEALLGMKKGESNEFSGTYPAKEGEEPRTAEFSVEVKECYRKNLPSDEELVKNLAKESLDEVKEDIRKRLTSLREDLARRAHSQKVEEAVLSKATVEIPAVMIERREQELLRRFAERLQEANTSLDAYLNSTGKTVEELRKDIHEEAEKDVRRDLVLDAIADKENTQVPPEVIDEVVEAFARQTGSDAGTIKTTLQMRGALDNIVSDLRRVEVMKKLAVKAAEKAGTPLPLEEKKTEVVEEAEKATAQEARPAEETQKEESPVEDTPAEEAQVEEAPAEEVRVAEKGEAAEEAQAASPEEAGTPQG